MVEVEVEAGTRVVLTGDGTRTALRTLGAAHLDGAWELPVLAAATGLRDATGTVELTTPRGLLTLPARLSVTAHGLVLRPAPSAGGPPARLRQRRDDVRGPLELPLRCAVLPDGDPDEQHGPVLSGLTTSVSGGGVGLLLHPVPARHTTAPAPGDLLQIDLDLHPHLCVPAVAEVVDASPVVRARFLRISPRDREHLVRAVFEAERHALTQARRGPSTR